MNRVQGLDKARALAALSVMLAHLVGPYLPGVLRYAFTGGPAVIAFFVVSGFCIHYPYRSKPLAALAFVTARFVRIGVPMSIAMILAAYLGVREFNLTDGFILWSLVCELWYYALYPLFLVAARLVGWRLLWFLAMAISYSLVISIGSDQYGNIHIFGPWLNWAVCLPAWLLVCLLAENYSARSLPVVPVRVAIAVVASLLYWATLNTPVGFYLSLNLFALLVFVWVRNEINRGTPTWLDAVGGWSYSIYLFHVVAAAFVGKLSGQPMMIFAGSLLGCYCAYRLIEAPTHRLARIVFTRLRHRLAASGA